MGKCRTAVFVGIVSPKWKTSHFLKDSSFMFHEVFRHDVFSYRHQCSAFPFNYLRFYSLSTKNCLPRSEWVKILRYPKARGGWHKRYVKNLLTEKFRLLLCRPKMFIIYLKGLIRQFYAIFSINRAKTTKWFSQQIISQVRWTLKIITSPSYKK